MVRFVALKMARTKTGEIRASVDVIESQYILHRRIFTSSSVNDCLRRANNVAKEFGIREPVLALGPR